jgi:CheY-like chemotaxis protein
MSSAANSAKDSARVSGPLGASRDDGSQPSGVQALNPGARILVVDDDPLNQEIARRMLGRFGYAAEIAVNGEVAIQRFVSGKFDLILMDCEMPVMDGFGAAQRIRDLESQAGQHRIPIIAATARVWSEVRERCESAGMDDFVVKPFDAAQLGGTLKRWFDPAGDESPVPGNETSPAPAVPTASALDPAALEGIRKLGAAGDSLVARVVGQYQDSAVRAAATIRKCLESGDSDSAWRAAHTLKSSSGTLGAHRLSAHSSEIERLSRDQGTEAAMPLLAKLDAELACALAELAPFGPPGTPS